MAGITKHRRQTVLNRQISVEGRQDCDERCVAEKNRDLDVQPECKAFARCGAGLQGFQQTRSSRAITLSSKSSLTLTTMKVATGHFIVSLSLLPRELSFKIGALQAAFPARTLEPSAPLPKLRLDTSLIPKHTVNMEAENFPAPPRWYRC